MIPIGNIQAQATKKTVSPRHTEPIEGYSDYEESDKEINGN